MPRDNKYKKTWNILKSKKIDERLECLDEGPTNSTSGTYIQTPGYYSSNSVSPDLDVPGAITSVNPDDQDLSGTDEFDLVTKNTQLDLDIDDPEQNGQDTSGLFYEDGTSRAIEPPGDTTAILGPMISMWYAWANYTQIGYVRESDRKMVNLGRITGELENWDGESGFTSYGQLTVEQAAWYKDQDRADYRAFYPGPPSNVADDFGRYLGSITTEGKDSVLDYIKKLWNSSTCSPWDPNDWVRFLNRNSKKLIAGYGLRPDGTSGMNRVGDVVPDHSGNPMRLIPRILRDGTPAGPDQNIWSPIRKAGGGGNSVVAHYEPEGERLLTESRRKSILKNVKKPVPELPENKIKYKSSGRDSKGNKTIGKGLMPEPDAVKNFNPAKKPPSVWGKGQRDRNIRSSQEKKNEVLELIGEGDHFWEKLIEKNQRGFDNSKKRIEEENERISEMIADEMQSQYETHMIKERKIDKLKDVVKKYDYPYKPSRAGYPNDPPPEPIDGYHPDLVDIDKKVNFYNTLDVQSARAMPKTASKAVDAKVKEIARRAKIKGERRLKNPK